MKKTKLINLVEKAALGSDEPKVLIKVNDQTATIHNYIKKDGAVRLVVTVNDFGVDDNTIAIPDHKQLTNILKALDDEISVNVTKTSLLISDNSSDVQLGLGDPVVFEDFETTRAIKTAPPINAEFELSKEFIERFQKSKAALGTGVVGVNTNGENIEFILGYSPTQNKNKITLSVGGTITTSFFDTFAFDAGLISNVFAANKDFLEASWSIAVTPKATLSTLKFSGDGWNTLYLVPNVNVQ